MELVPYTDADMWLVEALETDPVVMAELGGPWPPERIPEIHRKRSDLDPTQGRCLKIVPAPGADPIGTIMLWRSEWRGEPISELGWTILPAHHGRGFGSAALGLLLERARDDGYWGDLHAFPGVTNAASNALCRKYGFELHETTDVSYGERTLRVNHWVLRPPP